jgi:TolB protein
MADVITTPTSIKFAEPLVRLTNMPWTDTSPNWSPDGSHIVFVSERDGNSEIWTMRADGSDAVRLTNNAWGESMPVWSPDGTRILYTTDRDGSVELFLMNADGSNQVNLTNSPFWEGCASWLR